MYDNDDDDEPISLHPDTLAGLQEFYRQQLETKNNPEVHEDWQLSQFWYSEETSRILAGAAVSAVQTTATTKRIALLSCPTLYKPSKALAPPDTAVTLFEYDKRFDVYAPDFEFYDYNTPLEIKDSFKEAFDVVVLDPPFLSEECLSKFVKTVEFLRKESTNVILCTGAIMEDLARNLLHVNKCQFRPQHKNNLGNEFICMTNFGEIN